LNLNNDFRLSGRGWISRKQVHFLGQLRVLTFNPDSKKRVHVVEELLQGSTKHPGDNSTERYIQARPRPSIIAS
jgi:hypothetical protein